MLIMMALGGYREAMMRGTACAISKHVKKQLI